MFKIKESGRSSSYLFSLGIETNGEKQSNTTHLYLFGRYWYVQIPQLIKPKTQKKKYSFAEGEYTEYINRRYAFHISREGLHIYHGTQPGQWIANDPENSNKSFYWEYPWKDFYQCKYELLDVITGDVIYHTEKSDYSEAQKSAPKIVFTFKDTYDDAPITATCYYESRTYRVAHRKHKFWSFLQLFIADQVRPALWCEFDNEVGDRKGSWKGGITGMGAEVVDSGDLLTAFRKKMEGSGLGYDVQLLGYM